MDNYILCDSPSRLDDALGRLKSSPARGKILAGRVAASSLISLRTVAPSPQTFLIDAVLLEDPTLPPLFNLFESPVPALTDAWTSASYTMATTSRSQVSKISNWQISTPGECVEKARTSNFGGCLHTCIAEKYLGSAIVICKFHNFQA